MNNYFYCYLQLADSILKSNELIFNDLLNLQTRFILINESFNSCFKNEPNTSAEMKKSACRKSSKQANI